MELEQILQYLKEKYENLPCYPQILSYAERALKNWQKFKVDEKDDGVRISSIIDEIERGSFGLLRVREDKETGEISVISIKKEYMPQYELRYGWSTEVGLNMFTDSSTATFDKDGLRTNGTWYSDEDKYYQLEEKSVEGIAKAIKDTSPKYDERGVIVGNPESSYRPFTNIWERIGKTRVVHRHGRSPIDGEYSDVGVTYKNEDGKEEEKYFLSENQGRVYQEGRGWFGTLEEVASQIEPLIDECMGSDIWGEKTVLDTEKLCKKLMKNRDVER